MQGTFFYTLFIAFAFAFWPIMVRFGNIPAIWSAIIINASTTILAIAYLFYKGNSVPNLKMFLIGIFAGLLNGVAFLIYTNLLSNNNMSASVIVTIITIMVPVFVTILGVLLFKEDITVYRVIGITLAILGVYFIYKK